MVRLIHFLNALLVSVLILLSGCLGVTGESSADDEFQPGAAIKSAASIELTGSSTRGAIDAGSAYTFERQIIYTTSEVSFNLKNKGEKTASELSASVLSAPFSYKGGSFPGTNGTCKDKLEGNASCSISVEFAPTTVDTHTAVITLTYNNGKIRNSAATTTKELSAEAYSLSPVISLISPSIGNTFGGTTLTVTGNYFRSGMTVTLGGTACQNIVVADSHQTLTCTTAAHAAGSASLVLTNALGQSSTMANAFTYVAPTYPSRYGNQTHAAAGLATSRLNFVTVDGNYAYVSDSFSWLSAGAATDGIRVFDISNKSAPVYLNRITVGATPYASIVRNGYLYVACLNSAKVYIVDVTNPTSPGSSLAVNVGTRPLNMSIKDNYLYVVNSTANTLSVIDVTVPLSASVVATVATGVTPNDIAISGNALYVSNQIATWYSTLGVYDISNPALPVLTTTLATSTTLKNARTIHVNGNRLYIGHWGGSPAPAASEWSYGNATATVTAGFSIFDITTPTSPTLTSSVPKGACYGIATVGDYVMCSSVYGSQKIFYAKDASNVQYIDDSYRTGSTNVGWHEGNMAVSGGYSYLTGNDGSGLSIFSLSDLINLP